ncbi:MAG: transglutaminase-like cysteine peptidase [Methylococcales bacterium]|nr:transglutaminase-like cysteine peptidase [Methylococcales bacterium]
MKRINNNFFTYIKLILLTLSIVSCSNKVPGISEAKLEEIELNYGKKARRRVEDWRYLIEDNKDLTEKNKLVLVNNFINQVDFEDDNVHWKQNDYWATPIETLASNGGDCEDFSLAKYFTLSELGIADQCLRMTYVKAMPVNKPHMVLTYQCRRSDRPLVLDNLNTSILPAEQRKDLLPVYSFNVQGLWIAKQRGMGQKVGNKERSSLWVEFLQRLAKEKSAE